MYLARVLRGRPPQVYVLCGSLYFPRAWPFVSYARGAAAIDDSRSAAIKAAERLLERFSDHSLRHGTKKLDDSLVSGINQTL